MGVQTTQTLKREVDLEQQKIQLEIYKLVLHILLLFIAGAVFAVNNIPAEEVLGII